MKLFDPTSKPVERAVKLAPRPASPKGLRLGLVDNTKFNSDTLLAKLGERLALRHRMTVTVTNRKRSPVLQACAVAGVIIAYFVHNAVAGDALLARGDLWGYIATGFAAMYAASRLRA